MSEPKLRIVENIDLELDYLKLIDTSINPFPVNTLPKILQEVVYETNNKFQFALDYICAGILNAAASSIGNKIKVKVKEEWVEKCNLFTVIVGRPGDGKSHALNFCFKPIHIKENHLYEEYKKLLKEYEESTNESKIKPKLNKYLITDYTPEALILHHTHNEKGLTIYVDELLGWLRGFNRYNNSGEAEFYLSLWSGSTISSDRASGKSLRVEDPFIGVIGSAQISVLKSFGKDGRTTNGFLDRLLFVYPENQKALKWNIDNVVPQKLENYYNIISNLIELSDSIESSIVIPIEKKAKEYLFNWQNNRPENHLFDFERSIDIKLQQYVIRFSLIIQLLHHITDNKSKDQIELFAIKGGIELYYYFHHNAMKVRRIISNEGYFEGLTELQKTIFKELPKKFSTAQGINIACRTIDGKPRISDRQFKKILKDKKLFKRVSHGKYEKIDI